MPSSAGGGEAPDRRAEGVMSRPAGEALPQHPRPPPPQVVPPPRALGVGDPPSGTPPRPARSPAAPPPSGGPQLCAIRRVQSLGGLQERALRPASRPAPRPAAQLPAPPAPRAPPLLAPPRPLPGSRGAGPPAGEAPSRDCALARRALCRPTERPDLAPRAPRAAGFCCRRLLGRRLLRTASRTRRDLGSALRGRGLCGPGRDPREARAGGRGAPAPPWSCGPEAGGCFARPPRWPPAPAGTQPARAGAAAKSARSTEPRASA